MKSNMVSTLIHLKSMLTGMTTTRISDQHQYEAKSHHLPVGCTYTNTAGARTIDHVDPVDTPIINTTEVVAQDTHHRWHTPHGSVGHINF